MGCGTPGEFSDRLTLSDIYLEASLRATDQDCELFDCLVSPDEKQADLCWLGRPSIGSAVVSRIRQSNSQGPWAELINDIQADCANGDVPRIHLFGSIFGGTGSSGLPTLGTLLSRELKGVRSSVQIRPLFYCLTLILIFRMMMISMQKLKTLP